MAKSSQFANGYQAALNELSDALDQGGLTRMLEWARDNSLNAISEALFRAALIEQREQER